MLANSRKNKENHCTLPSHSFKYLNYEIIVDDPTRNDMNNDEIKLLKLREFGTELTNNTEASSD